MVEYSNEQAISEILKSMSDETRRSLLTRLCQEGPCRVTDLASYYDMSLNAISKHIKVLERCEMITRTTIGRTHWIEADLARIHIVENWFNELKSIWELRLVKLTELMETEIKND
jgi:DNA-binding transcriptional ArsR family regulator